MAAFRRDGHDGRAELQVVTRTWNCHATPPGLELVAVRDHDEIVGHVLAAAALVTGPSGAGHVVLGVAPLSVRPDVQRRGIGTDLMTELLRRAAAGPWPIVAVLGDPGYYRRFGFGPASGLSISYGGTTPADPHFMALRLRPGPPIAGELRYCWELYPDGRDRYEEGDPLPPYCSTPVQLMCDYGAEVPLFPQSEFVESLVPPPLRSRLEDWQADFERHYLPEDGWRTAAARERWERTARAIEPEVRAAFAGKAEVEVDLWPLAPDDTEASVD